MKNGYTYHAVEGEVSGGSYGRAVASVQAGGQIGNLSGYITADAIDDAGWRRIRHRRCAASMLISAHAATRPNFTSPSRVPTITSAPTPATPVQMLAQNWASTYTMPQTTQNQLAFLTASATWKPSDTWTYQAIAYFRNFRKATSTATPTNAQNSGCPDPTVLCFPNLDGTVSNLTTTRGQTVPQAARSAQASWARSIAPGQRPTVSAAPCRRHRRKKCFGHDNNFTIGLSVDRGLVQFAETSELGNRQCQSVPVRARFGTFHQPAFGRRRASRIGRDDALYRPLRDRHARRHVTPVGHRRRSLQLRANQFDRRARQQRRCSTAITPTRISIR